MNLPTVKRNLFQRLMGKPATHLPVDPECWTLQGNTIDVDLSRAHELSTPGGALRIEKEGIPDRVLVVRDDSGSYRAYCNKCNHGGRHLDPVPGTSYLQCCSFGKSTYDENGKVVFGPASRSLTRYHTTVDGTHLVIDLV